LGPERGGKKGKKWAKRGATLISGIEENLGKIRLGNKG